jgi:aminopeptidase N
MRVPNIGRRKFLRTRVVVLVAIVAALATGCLGGIGDRYFPTYGNAGYDVHHYDLAVTYDPNTDVLQGVATITAKAQLDLTHFHLDLVGLTVHGVAVDGKPAPFSRDRHELVIDPRTKIGQGRIFTVIVDYSGVPTVLGGGGFYTTNDGALAVGEPEVATTWYPVNDHPLDKATYTFRVTTPNASGVVANGVPRAPIPARPGWTTQIWDARSPMASYLATIAIGAWDIRDRREDGLRIIDAVDPKLGNLADSSLARQSEILDFLATQFAHPYPFEVAGGIVDDLFVGFALENQTRPFYDPIFFRIGQGDTVIVHELAHQWFGDDIALGRWQDVWLNEGFATYAEWLWAEHEGSSTVEQTFIRDYLRFPANDPLWQLPIGDPGPTHLFDDAVYERGAMTLQALRVTVGDAKFFAILRAWADQQAGGNATTPEFVALAEQVSGMQLDPLFDQWLFTPGRPSLPAAAAADAATAPTTASESWVDQWHAGLLVRLEQGAR